MAPVTVHRFDLLDDHLAEEVAALVAGDLPSLEVLADHRAARRCDSAGHSGLVARAPDGRLLGYLHVGHDLMGAGHHVMDLLAPPPGAEAGTDRPEVVDALIDALLRDPPHGTVTWWVREANPSPSIAVAARRGLLAVREVRRMEHQGLLTIDPPGGPLVTVASDESWLDEVVRVNNLAFADHPDRAHVTRDHVAATLAELGDHPEDILVRPAPDGDGAAAFAWMKRHASGEAEVYVLAVDPRWHGHGFGGALIDHCLLHAAALGASTTILYVERENRGAIALYERKGFVDTGRPLRAFTLPVAGG